MGRFVVIACAAFICACGARTGLDTGEAPGRDAAAPFDTFPCSWSWGLPLELARGADVYGGLRGAVHGSRDEAFVMATEDGERVGARLALTNPPSLIARYALEPGDDDVVGGERGWASSSACRITLRDADFGPSRRLDVTSVRARACAFTPTDSRFLDVQVIRDVELIGVRFDEAGERLATCTTAIEAGAPGAVVRGPSGQCAAVFLEAGALVLRREDGAEAILGEATSFALTDDALRPGALVVRRDERSRLHFARVPFEGEPRVGELGATDETPEQPLSVVTNETEALVPLRGGSLAIQPLSGSALRVLPPPETGGAIETLRVVMRAGSSLGGAIYVIRERDERALRFAPLSCNR
jgi:hypothetical protein